MFDIPDLFICLIYICSIPVSDTLSYIPVSYIKIPVSCTFITKMSYIYWFHISDSHVSLIYLLYIKISHICLSFTCLMQLSHLAILCLSCIPFSYISLFQALLAPGVFDTGHFIPYIFMEWDIISAGHKFCTNITALITLLKSRDYFPINLDPLGKLSDVCLQKQMQDMVWMHKNAHPLWEGDHVFYECEPYS